jgi:serine O-acetyltransferase
MKFSELKYFWRSDFHRYDVERGWKTALTLWVLCPGFKYSMVMRWCTYLKSKDSKLVYFLFYIPSYLLLNCYSRRYGIGIPCDMKVGPGLFISNFGGIFAGNEAVIGKNCNISTGVVIGRKNRGRYEGYPKIGDNVYIGAGAKVIGGIKVGNNVAIGANCVVTKDIPDNAVVVGIPGRVISYEGSSGYVINTDY